MSGDPKVLAGLQQAFKETDDGRVQQQIVYAWCHETGNYNIYSLIESEIRAWSPPPAEPSLEQRVGELELKLSAVSATMQEHETDLENFGNQIHELFNRTDPEPTAPDDPVCQCGHEKSFHKISGTRPCMYSPDSLSPYCECESFLPAPQPAPDLDPVLRDGREQAIKQQAIVTVLQRYRHLTSFFDKSSLNRMALEMLQEMDKDGGA